jgi:hypothetical protein
MIISVAGTKHEVYVARSGRCNEGTENRMMDAFKTVAKESEPWKGNAKK